MMKKKYQQPALMAIQMEKILLNTVSGEDFTPEVTPSDEEGV
jgi:hypothetical protein